MKRFSKSLFVLLFVIAVALFSVKSYAVSNDGELSVKMKGDNFAFYNGNDCIDEKKSLQELINAHCKGKKVVFDKIVCSEVLNFDFSFELSGTLTTDKNINIMNNSEVTLNGMNIYLKNVATVSNQGGNLTLNSSNITSEYNSAVTLCEFSYSTYTQNSGLIKSQYSGATFKLEKGTANFCGGGIENSNGPCIYNNSTLFLSGSVAFRSPLYDIISNEPIFLLKNGKSFLGNLKVQFMKEFLLGEMTEVFKDAKEEHEKNIKVFDKNGKEEQITYFENYKNSASKNFVSVYKPYEAQYYSFSTHIRSENFLKNEKVPNLELEAKEGYIFKGWFSDENCESPYDFSKNPSSDIKLYAGYSLQTPIFSIADKTFVYDGKKHSCDFSSISHPLDKYAIYSFLWKDNSGKTVSRTRSFSVQNVNQSGEYYCEITFSTGKHTVSFSTPKITVTVQKAKVDTPIIPSVYYTGGDQIPNSLKNPLYTYEKNKFVSAGTYKIKFSLTDAENYRWRESDGADILVNFEIKRADNKWTSEIVVENTYFGDDIKCSATSLFGVPKFVFSTTRDGVYTATRPTSVGKYFAKAIVDESADYLSIESEPCIFEICEDIPISMSLEKMPTKTVYEAFSFFDKSGIKIRLNFKSGKFAILENSELSVIYQSGDNLRFTDTGVIVQYLSFKVFVPVTVNKTNYNFIPHFENLEVTFDGKFHTITLSDKMPIGKDGIPLEFEISGGGSDSGIYTVKLTFKTKSENYNLPPAVEKTLEIKPKKVNVVWGEREFTYDGTFKIPDAYFIDCLGAKIYLQVEGGSINAGTSIKSTASTDDKNYELNGKTTTFTVKKAKYDLSKIKWENTNFVFDGEYKGPSLCGLPLGVSVKVYTNSKFSEAGEYFAEAVLSYDEKNYEKPIVDGTKWCIEKANYPLDSFEFMDFQTVFDGKFHYPSMKGTLPVGKDGIPLDFKYSHGVRDVLGRVEKINIIFITKSDNYNAPSSITRTVEILPCGIYVDWNGLEFVYDGQEKTPTAKSNLCKLNITGGRVDCGEYVAVCESLDSNYKVLNSKQKYKILKSPNKIIEKINIGNIFYGSNLNHSVLMQNGNAEFFYFDDEKLENKIENPREVGTYFCIFKVAESKNYLPFTSEVYKFEIMPVLPVSLKVVRTENEIFAFEKACERHFQIFLVYNNKKEEVIPFSECSFLYENGDSFRCRDEKMTVRYGDFSCQFSVSVSKADYDLSGVYWDFCESVYDRKIKQPNLLNLPLGVSVSEYTYPQMKNAGEYLLSAKLNYDTENYNEPILKKTTFTIHKCNVELPDFEFKTYEGVPLVPDFSSDVFYISDKIQMVGVGKYSIVFSLFDSDNYEFKSTNIGIFEIVRRPLTVKISDKNKYWFEAVKDFDFEIVEGELANGDILQLTFGVDGNEIYAECIDENYDISFINGEIKQLKRFAPEVTKALIISLLVFLLLTLLLVTFVYRKDAIVKYFRCFTCKIKDSANNKKATCPKIETVLSVDSEKANILISNSASKMLIRKIKNAEEIEGKEKVTLSLDEIIPNFSPFELVTVNTLKGKGLIGNEVRRIKIVEGKLSLDKPLKIYADSFSLTAVKMIALTGGEIYKTV